MHHGLVLVVALAACLDASQAFTPSFGMLRLGTRGLRQGQEGILKNYPICPTYERHRKGVALRMQEDEEKKSPVEAVKILAETVSTAMFSKSIELSPVSAIAALLAGSVSVTVSVFFALFTITMFPSDGTAPAAEPLVCFSPFSSRKAREQGLKRVLPMLRESTGVALGVVPLAPVVPDFLNSSQLCMPRAILSHSW